MSLYTQPNPMFLHLIADDRSLITYRPKLNQLTKSITATILLQQILYWWKKADCQDFYKFKAPCGHPDYKPEDSWTEELGMSLREFDTAIKVLKKLNYVETKSTFDRKTIYIVNFELLKAELDTLYSVNAESADSYITNAHTAKQQKRIQLNDKSAYSITNTETTTETTTDIIKEINKEKPKLKFDIGKSKFDPERFIDTLSLSEVVKDLLTEWCRMRKDKPTQRAIELVTRDLLKHTEADRIEMIENSLKNGWKGIFELKPNYNQNSGGHSIRPSYSTTGVERLVDTSDLYEPGAFDHFYN